jgi:hypothetical protein
LDRPDPEAVPSSPEVGEPVRPSDRGASPGSGSKESESREAPPSPEPIDPEASFYDLEARQTRWFEYREEWMRRKAAGQLHPSDEESPSKPSSTP